MRLRFDYEALILMIMKGKFSILISGIALQSEQPPALPRAR